MSNSGSNRESFDASGSVSGSGSCNNSESDYSRRSSENGDSSQDATSETVQYTESDDESSAEYCKGGYHPVKINEIYNGRYRIEGKLGWGHFSTVWVATDLKSKPLKFVAIKIQKGAESYLETAKCEITYLETIKESAFTGFWVKLKELQRNKLLHYNMTKGVVSLIDSFEHEGPNGTHICMVFEFMGPNLLSLIKHHGYKGIPLNLVRKIATHVLIGLQYLHEICKIIHSDVKPENVLVSPLSNMPRPKDYSEKTEKQTKEKKGDKTKKKVHEKDDQIKRKNEQGENKNEEKREVMEVPENEKGKNTMLNTKQELGNVEESKLSEQEERNLKNKKNNFLKEAEKEEVTSVMENEKREFNESVQSVSLKGVGDSKDTTIIEAVDGDAKKSGDKILSNDGSMLKTKEMGEVISKNVKQSGSNDVNGPSYGDLKMDNEDVEKGLEEKNLEEKDLEEKDLEEKDNKEDEEDKYEEIKNIFSKKSNEPPYVKHKLKPSNSDPSLLTSYLNIHALQETLTKKPYHLNNYFLYHPEKYGDNKMPLILNRLPYDYLKEKKTEKKKKKKYKKQKGSTIEDDGNIADQEDQDENNEDEDDEDEDDEECLKNDINKFPLYCDMFNHLMHPEAIKLHDILKKNSKNVLEIEEMNIRESNANKHKIVYIQTHEGPYRIRPFDPAVYYHEHASYKICDLGNSLWIDEARFAEIQTRQYRAPEVILKSGFDEKADIWSFACMVFELVTGDFLFNPQNRGNYDKNEEHLSYIIKLLGAIPKHMIDKGYNSHKYFHKETYKLKHITDVKYYGLKNILKDRYRLPDKEVEPLVSFLLPMLAINPECRASASLMLQHPWLNMVSVEDDEEREEMDYNDEEACSVSYKSDGYVDEEEEEEEEEGEGVENEEGEEYEEEEEEKEEEEEEEEEGTGEEEEELSNELLTYDTSVCVDVEDEEEGSEKKEYSGEDEEEIEEELEAEAEVEDEGEEEGEEYIEQKEYSEEREKEKKREKKKEKEKEKDTLYAAASSGMLQGLKTNKMKKRGNNNKMKKGNHGLYFHNNRNTGEPEYLTEKFNWENPEQWAVKKGRKGLDQKNAGSYENEGSYSYSEKKKKNKNNSIDIFNKKSETEKKKKKKKITGGKYNIHNLKYHSTKDTNDREQSESAYLLDELNANKKNFHQMKDERFYQKVLQKMRQFQEEKKEQEKKKAELLNERSGVSEKSTEGYSQKHLKKNKQKIAELKVEENDKVKEDNEDDNGEETNEEEDENGDEKDEEEKDEEDEEDEENNDNDDDTNNNDNDTNNDDDDDNDEKGEHFDKKKIAKNNKDKSGKEERGKSGSGDGVGDKEGGINVNKNKNEKENQQNNDGSSIITNDIKPCEIRINEKHTKCKTENVAVYKEIKTHNIYSQIEKEKLALLNENKGENENGEKFYEYNKKKGQCTIITEKKCDDLPNNMDFVKNKNTT